MLVVLCDAGTVRTVEVAVVPRTLGQLADQLSASGEWNPRQHRLHHNGAPLQRQDVVTDDVVLQLVHRRRRAVLTDDDRHSLLQQWRRMASASGTRLVAAELGVTYAAVRDWQRTTSSLMPALANSVRTGRLKPQALRTCRARVLRVVEVDDDAADIAVTNATPTPCPLSGGRVVTPVRGVDCQHQRCFDLASYLQLFVETEHRGRPLWDRCCICRGALHPDRLFAVAD